MQRLLASAVVVCFYATFLELSRIAPWHCTCSVSISLSLSLSLFGQSSDPLRKLPLRMPRAFPSEYHRGEETRRAGKRGERRSAAKTQPQAELECQTAGEDRSLIDKMMLRQKLKPKPKPKPKLKRSSKHHFPFSVESAREELLLLLLAQN